jgi:hypothetical protein
MIEFSALMSQFGVSNEKVVSSLFQIMHRDRENIGERVTVASASSLLFTLAGKGEPKDHLQSIFDACDLEFDHELHRHEVQSTLLSLLHMREELLVQRTAEDSQKFMFAVPVKTAEPEDLIELQSRRAKRFQMLKNRAEKYESCETMEELLQREAETLTDNVFQEAYISDDKSPAGQISKGTVITEEEFDAWANGKPTKTSKDFFRLFSAFKNYESAMPGGGAHVVNNAKKD